MKIKQGFTALICGAALVGLCATAANATNDPEWWVENSDVKPEFWSDYTLFTLTPEEAMAYDSNADADCNRKALGDGNAQIACNAEQYARIDKRLNRAYRELMAALPKHRQQRLRQEQREWLSARDAKCVHIAATKHAEQQEILDHSACRIRELARRTTWIERYHGFSVRKLK